MFSANCHNHSRSKIEQEPPLFLGLKIAQKQLVAVAQQFMWPTLTALVLPFDPSDVRVCINLRDVWNTMAGDDRADIQCAD